MQGFLRITVLSFFLVLGVSVYPLEELNSYSFSLDSIEEVSDFGEAHSFHHYPHSVSRQTNLWTALSRLGFESSDIYALVEAAKPFFDLNRITPAIKFRIAEASSFIEFQLGQTKLLQLIRKGEEWRAREKAFSIEKELITFQGKVVESLWNSATRADMDPSLVVELAEIFAWQIDFAREVRQGDHWRISVEKKLVRGRFAGWGAIHAAEYVLGDEVYQAFRYEKDGKLIGYFDEKGESLEKIFLKSPIKFGRISSHFSRRRFHPIRKVYRPHNGVDYAAPRGTPIRAVGDGRIELIGRRGGAGKMIRIRHNSVYKTAYLHMNRFARGLRKGSRVKQGQVIGTVGSTGLATGPHLHYEFYQRGRYVDPLGVKFPAAKPVPKAWLADFKTRAEELVATLPSWREDVARRWPAGEPKATYQ